MLQSSKILCPGLSENISLNLCTFKFILEFENLCFLKKVLLTKTPTTKAENFLIALFDLNQAWCLQKTAHFGTFPQCTHFVRLLKKSKY